MAIRELDRTDRRLLGILSDNGRIANTELADAASLSPSPCLRRVKRLEDEGVILGYEARLDYRKIGWGITAFVQINLEKHRKIDAESVRKELAEITRVIWCNGLAGPWDLMLRVVARDLDDYFDLVQVLGELSFVKDIQSTIVIGEIKNSHGTPVPSAR